MNIETVNLEDLIFLSATFKGNVGNQEKLKKLELKEKKRKNLNRLELKLAGEYFQESY